MNHRKLNRLSDSAVKEKQRFSFRKTSGILAGALLGSTLYFANSTQAYADAVSGNTATVKVDTAADDQKEAEDKSVTSTSKADNDSEDTVIYAETGGYTISVKMLILT